MLSVKNNTAQRIDLSPPEFGGVKVSCELSVASGHRAQAETDYTVEIYGVFGNQVEPQAIVGEMLLTVIDTAQISRTEHLFDYFSQGDPQLLDLYLSICDEDEFLNPEICEMLGLRSAICEPQSILYLRQICIHREFNGYGLGAKATRETMDYFANKCELIALKAQPLQLTITDDRDHGASSSYWDSLALDRYPTCPVEAQQKLQRHYEKCGFTAVDGGPFMVQRLGKEE